MIESLVAFMILSIYFYFNLYIVINLLLNVSILTVRIRKHLIILLMFEIDIIDCFMFIMNSNLILLLL